MALRNFLYVLLAAFIAAFPLAVATFTAPDFDAPMAWKLGASIRRAAFMAPAGTVVGVITLVAMRSRKNAFQWAIGSVALATVIYAWAFTTGVIGI